MRRLHSKMMMIAMMEMARSAPRSLVDPLELRPHHTAPMPVLNHQKIDRAEAKRARKAQIKRNGGRK